MSIQDVTIEEFFAGGSEFSVAAEEQESSTTARAATQVAVLMGVTIVAITAIAYTGVGFFTGFNPEVLENYFRMGVFVTQ